MIAAVHIRRCRLVVILTAVFIAASCCALLVAWRRSQAPPPLTATQFIQADYPVKSIRYSADGKYLVTTGEDLVTYRDALSGKLLRQWSGSGDRQWFSRDGRFMVASDYGGVGRPAVAALRDVRTGKALGEWRGKVKCVAPDFSYMLSLPTGLGPSSAGSRLANLIDLHTGRTVAHVGISADAAHFRFSRSGKWICESVDGGSSHLYHVPDMRSPFALPSLIDLVMVDNDRRAVGIAPDGTVQTWRVPTGEHASIDTGLKRATGASISLKCVIVEGMPRKTTCGESSLQLRSYDGVRLVKVFDGEAQALSPKGAYAAIVSSSDRDGGRCLLIGTATGKAIAKIDSITDPLGQAETGTECHCMLYAISPDGSRAASSTSSGLIRLYDLRASPPKIGGYVSIDPGQKILTPTASGQGIISDATVMPGGGVAAVGGAGSYGDKMSISQWVAGRVVASVDVEHKIGLVERLALSSNGSSFAAVSHLGLWTYNAASGRAVNCGAPAAIGSASGPVARPVWNERKSSAAAMKPDIAACAAWSLPADVAPQPQVIDGIAYRPKQVEPVGDGYLSIVTWFSPGPKLPTRQSDPRGFMELRDRLTGAVLKRPDTTKDDWRNWSYVHEEYRFAISADRSVVAASTANGQILLWSAKTGHRIGMMTCSRSGSSKLASQYPRSAMLAFSPDGKLLATARYDGSIYLYSMRTHLAVAQIGQTDSIDANYARPLTWLGYDAAGKYVYGMAMNEAAVRAWKVPDSLHTE